MSKVELSKISSLTLYKDTHTEARRTPAIPQLRCVGRPCRLFQPEVVRCVNLGGTGTDVDWKCEADLPDSLRFGKVDVSCEGWSGPGDPHVLKGSCSLEYRLVQVPDALRGGDSTNYPKYDPRSFDWGAVIFSVLWVAVLLFIVSSIIQSCLQSNTNPRRPTAPRTNSAGGGGGGNGGGWFPGDYRDEPNAPPPPYSYTKPADASSSSTPGWRPGFWTGAAVGGLANHLMNRRRTPTQPPSSSYDWERPAGAPPRQRSSFFGGGGSAFRRTSSSDDRGEGSSNLGSMRRSTGLGGSSVR